jgi:hypothetical protein
MRINITLDKEQKIGQQIVDAFQNELTRKVRCAFPTTRVTVKKGSVTGVNWLVSIRSQTVKRWTVSFRKYGKTKAGVKHANRDGAKLAFCVVGVEQLTARR